MYVGVKGQVTSILTEELEALKEQILSHHKDAGQVASGRTGESMHVDVSENEGTLFGRAAFGTLETGRAAGAVPNNFQAIIRQWMSDKGIKANPIPYKTSRAHKYTEQERGDMALSYLIARKIRNEGTKLFRQGGRADIYSNAVPSARERILQRLAGIMRVEIDSIKIHKVEV